MKRFAFACALLLCACTPGAMPAQGGSSGGGAVTTIDVNLTQHAPTQTPQGTSAGYAPAITTVAVGSAIRFTNSDGFAHTATLIPNATSFPAGSVFDASALTQKGSAISGSWTSGTMSAGASSQILTVDRAGTYLYGCFYHYGAPMRGVIVAQ